ncbi:GlxA family transcriptional regulator [Umezawaea tangerina]|uniref:AraC family transcriptional regulator with amidase-like domain n=1 Tax=Umezawaea tangerina TaxID=84725 RepID=A0A2T0SVP6_9PSEU|nr:helix-turn-helix domain-containing protein [Umezawaea tangerina]PRY37486.1 AraC family transcriptional regulator with amidase-like domain [Umezawaea tangerina]
MRRVTILAYDDVSMIDIAGPADVFGQANRFGADYRVGVVSPGGADVRTFNGVRVSVDGAARDAEPGGTAVVLGGYAMVETPLDPDLLEAARVLAAGADRVTAVCTGSFLLAELGLLDGRAATTHWRQVALFARRYPDVLVQPDSLYVHDGPFITSAGVSSGIDLALSLVEDDHGSEVAAEVARAMVVFLQRPGGLSQHSAASRWHVSRTSPLRAVLDAVAADPAADHSVPAMAAAASVSARQLSRLFHDEIGTTPARYVELVRLECAQDLLQKGHTVAVAAARSGFGSDETLRRVFTNRLGLSPTAYREQHRG